MRCHRIYPFSSQLVEFFINVLDQESEIFTREASFSFPFSFSMKVSLTRVLPLAQKTISSPTVGGYPKKEKRLELKSIQSQRAW